MVAAFARAYRCLRSVRELAGRGESEDAAVLTRALVSLAAQYLWLACVENVDERRDRLRRLQRKWASGRATLGEELIDLGYTPDDERSAEQFREDVAKFRARADELEREGIRAMPNERDIALRLDRDLQPETPRFFELLYTRAYRPTSHIAHYGIGAALGGVGERRDDDTVELSLEHADEAGAAESLGLALVTYAVLLDFSEPVIRHGLTADVGDIVRRAHRG
jgi:hypothetical protein